MDEHAWWRDWEWGSGGHRGLDGGVRHCLAVEGAGGKGALMVKEEAVDRGKVDLGGMQDDEILVVVGVETG